jgi:CheY-like chemotaxis protein
VKGKRVLVVDDDPRILESVSRYLEDEGALAETTDQPETVVRKAKEAAPDLILLDVLMPGKNGYEVLEELRGEPGTSRIPVVLMTAKAISLNMPAPFLQELSGILTKPISRQQFVKIVQAALSKRP